MRRTSFFTHLLLGALLLLTIEGCASATHKKRLALRDAFTNGQYEEGLQLVEELNPREDEKSALLYFLEKGMFYHSMGKYHLSSLYFGWASEKGDELFTKSLSKKALTAVANDTVDLYYGAIFERSEMHYYQALNFFMIYQSGKIESYRAIEANPKMKGSEKELNRETPSTLLSESERQQYLFKARAEIKAWDFHIDQWKNERQGKSVFKNDLLAKVLGGFIYEAIGSQNDLQVALLLYKDAKELLLKNYNAYPSLNRKAVDFKRDFEKLPSLPLSTVKTDYVSATPLQDELQNLLDYKIAQLTLTIRPYEMERVEQQLGISEKITTLAKNDISGKKKKDLVALNVFLELGMIPEKRAKKINIGWEGVLENIEDPKTKEQVSTIGTLILADFMASVLGLYPDPNNWSPIQAYGGLAVGAVMVSNVGFTFELPEVKSSPVSRKNLLQVFDSNNRLVIENPIVLVQPLGELAQEAVAEDSMSRYVRTGVRVGMKHLTAIISAFLTYKALNKGDNDFFAKSAAILQYTALSKGIEASEKADLRFWSTLPREIRSTQLMLSPGNYHLKLKSVNFDGSGEQVVELGSVSLDNKKDPYFLQYRVKQL